MLARQGHLGDNLENNARHQRNDMRTLALLKAIAGELVYADPTAKARIHNHLDHLLLLHGDDENFCNEIKEAMKATSAA
ncbi:hypothetical protein [Massilia sp. S19_KUP03_FR1]|uniref:hypothetical protein n=1 Tax=Massilia sp. S19_KUP03_FR1 TaxID=3025503 RepID=UPI002FCDD533